MIKNQKAIVTFALGEKYQKMFNDLCRLDWENYCKKYNYDFYLITEPLDDSSRAQVRSPVNRYQYLRHFPTSLGTAVQILPEKVHCYNYGA